MLAIRRIEREREKIKIYVIGRMGCSSVFMKRVFHRVFNSSANTLVRPLSGYYRISPFTSHTDNNDTVTPSDSLQIDLSNQEAKRRLFNRLLYRSKQRGFLELDLVLGKWVEDNIHSLDHNHIPSLIYLLDLVFSFSFSLLLISLIFIC